MHAMPRACTSSTEIDSSGQNCQRFPLNTFALSVEHAADVLAVKPHHTTVDATLESPLLSNPVVFLNAFMFGYPATIV
jgi:hypothetical protein